MDPIETIQAQIDALQAQLDALASSSQLDNNIESAFRERLGYDNAFLKTGLSTYGTQSLVVPAGGGTFSIPAQPTGTITVKFGSTTYSVPYI